jgi:hypothetical protein
MDRSFTVLTNVCDPLEKKSVFCSELVNALRPQFIQDCRGLSGHDSAQLRGTVTEMKVDRKLFLTP